MSTPRGFVDPEKKIPAARPPPGFTLTAHTEAAVAAHFIPPIAALIISYITPAPRQPRRGEYNDIRHCITMADARLYWHKRIADFATAGFFEPCRRALYSKAPEDTYIAGMCRGTPAAEYTRGVYRGASHIVAINFAANGYLAAVKIAMAADHSISPDTIAVAAARGGHIDIIYHIINMGIEFEAAEAMKAAKAAMAPGAPAIVALLSMYCCSAAALYDEYVIPVPRMRGTT